MQCYIHNKININKIIPPALFHHEQALSLCLIKFPFTSWGMLGHIFCVLLCTQQQCVCCCCFATTLVLFTYNFLILLKQKDHIQYLQCQNTASAILLVNCLWPQTMTLVVYLVVKREHFDGPYHLLGETQKIHLTKETAATIKLYEYIIHNLEIYLHTTLSFSVSPHDYAWCWQMALSEKSFVVVKVSIIFFLSRWKGPWGPMSQCQLIGMINVKRRRRQQQPQEVSSSFLLDLDWETKEHWPFLTISSIPNMEN